VAAAAKLRKICLLPSFQGAGIRPTPKENRKKPENYLDTSGSNAGITRNTESFPPEKAEAFPHPEPAVSPSLKKDG
jgi:hypothetical protein